MNNKILLELHVPIVNKVFEIFIPAGKNIKTVTELLKKSISSLDTPSNITSSMVICDGNTGKIIDPNLTIKEAGLQNGSKIILI